jgi:type III secretory pathway component EscV
MKSKITRYLVLKIVGLIGIAVAVTGIVLYIISIDNGGAGSGLFIAGLLMMILGILSGVPCIFIGFLPRLLEARVQAMQTLQQQNIHILKEVSQAATEASNSIKAANDSNKMYCKYCGVQIDADSKFCKSCGKEL